MDISSGLVRTSRPPGRPSRRRVGLLGGTTTAGDCALAARLLIGNDGLVEGDSIRAYERTFAQFVGVGHAFSFAAARVGFYGLLRALGIGEGDEVLLQVPTHIVVANAISYTGARPVYVDCRLDTYNIDLEDAERLITPRTRALVLQHTFGIPADLSGAAELADRHELVLIEDCVHALGATFGGKQLGGFGRAAFFSTEETKTISTTMGGVVTTDDGELAADLARFQASCSPPPAGLVRRYLAKLISYHLLTEPHVHRYTRPLYELAGQRQPLPRPTTAEEIRGLRPPEYERRFSNAQAAIGLRQMERLEENLAHRRKVAAAYRERLAASGLRVPEWPAEAQPAFVRYPVWVEDREAAERKVRPHAVLGKWFTSVLEEATSPSVGRYEAGSCERAEAAACHLVNLPTHLRVTSDDIDAITAALGTA
jgi:perosamine synthetase